MKTKTIVVSLVLSVVLVNTTIAQTVGREWDAVRSLSSGEKLSVRLKDGKKLDGILRSVSDTLLVLDRGNNASDLARDSVSKVYRIERKSTARSIGKPTLIGAGIGFGIGAGVGIAAGNYEDLGTGELVAVLGGLGAAIGAGIGAIVGAIGSKERRVLVYEAK
ncbi:MAG: hypothetical protein WAV47_06145 [Blastocatellia bacterium]